MDNSKFSVVEYLANRYAGCNCISCKKEFWFMIKEYEPDYDSGDVTLTCPTCGYKRKMNFDMVKKNIESDGYSIDSLIEFESLVKQANTYSEEIHKALSQSEI